MITIPASGGCFDWTWNYSQQWYQQGRQRDPIKMQTGPLTYLKVRSPSPSSISYTASSISSPRSLLLNALRHSIRVVVSFYAILALLSKAQDDGLMDAIDLSIPVPLLLHYSLIGDFIRGTAQSFNWWFLCFTSLLTLYLCLRRDYTGNCLPEFELYQD